MWGTNESGVRRVVDVRPSADSGFVYELRSQMHLAMNSALITSSLCDLEEVNFPL